MISLFAFLLCLSTVFSPGTPLSCPVDCRCQDKREMTCSELTVAQVEEVFSAIPMIPWLDTLQRLTFNDCELVDMSSFPVIPNLAYLDLSANRLEHVDSLRHLSFPSVLSVNLSHNHLTLLGRDSFVMFPNVEELYIDYNLIGLIDWEAFRLFKLRRLHLNNNVLSSISEHILRFTPNLEFISLAHNHLVAVQSSNFFAAQRLRRIDLSYNYIQRFDYDSFSPLYQLEILDLSFNNLTTIPGSDFKQLVGLRVLNISGNPIAKIASGDLSQPVLQVFDLSHTNTLRVVEARAFSRTPSLQIVNLNNNRKFSFISPYAFVNTTLLYEINVSNTSLEVIPDTIFSKASKVELSGCPLQCSCLQKSVGTYYATIHNPQTANCSTSSGHFVNVGEYFSLFCSANVNDATVMWTLPNGSQIVVKNTSEQLAAAYRMETRASGVLGMHSTGYEFLPSGTVNRPRVLATSEQLRFDVLLPGDSGEYKCTVTSGGYSSQRSMRLDVELPFINIYPLEVGSHYVSLAWNNSLKIKANDRVRLYLNVSETGKSSARSIQLSLQNPWFSYNVMRLKSDQNYTFCLVYVLFEGTQGRTFHLSCVDVATLPNLSFWASLSWSTVVTSLLILTSLCLLVCFRTFYVRFHIWQQAKYRSRMNQSLSGQSFLSNSSRNGNALSHSITFENRSQTSELLAQSHSLTRFPSSSNQEASNGRLLTVEDIAV
uniref:Ig-like domain-containing protein n=1 Tax=Steinernema glaseri TaxID=37863 RepID=A0A1I8AT38_9BILA